MAKLHQVSQPYFGFDEDNYIGSILQNNQPSQLWHLYYAECRLLPLVKKLFNAALFSIVDLNAAEKLCDKLRDIFPPEPPSLLHGDLWSGNFMVAANGSAAIFDPAVYYGHREMDIGMSKLFGGFSDKFYDAYLEIYPLEKGWTERVEIAQLYPLLVHALLFGGGYIVNARKILKKFAC